MFDKQVVPGISGHDVTRTRFTFSNLGPAPVFSVTVDTIRLGHQTMDFEMIEELLPGACLTCLSIIHPVVGNDPHWAFDFWTASGEDFTLPFIVRYAGGDGRSIVTRSILKWDGRRVSLQAHD